MFFLLGDFADCVELKFYIFPVPYFTNSHQVAKVGI